MPGTADYIKQFGETSFSEMPFGDADNVALCEIFYMPLEKVVSSDFNENPQDFAQACNSLYELNGKRHRPPGLFLPKTLSKKLMEMSKQKRFSEMKIAACTEVFASQPAVQFAAASFILPDNKLVLLFRGTDDSLIGWREDIDIYIKKIIPSYRLALDYLERAAATFSGDIILCGHSKGGNVALYAALNCSEAVRSRIVRLYNNDGPGYCDYSLFRTYAYRELLPNYRHFIPHSSLIGLLLAHDNDYNVIKSNKLLGIAQHDLGTWQIKDCELVPAELTKTAKVLELSLMNLISRMNEEQNESVDRLANAVLDGIGQPNLTGVAKNALTAFVGAAKSIKNVDEQTRNAFKDVFRDFSDVVKEAVKTVNSEKEAETKAAPVAKLFSKRRKTA